MSSTPDPAAIETPCVKLCAVAPASGMCIGCGRSLREIGAWRGLSPAARRQIMAILPERLARLRALDPEAFADADDAR